MTGITIYKDALRRAQDEIEAFNPESTTLHYIKGILAVAPNGARGRKEKVATADDLTLRQEYEAGATLLLLSARHNATVTKIRAGIVRAGGTIGPAGQGPRDGKFKRFPKGFEQYKASWDSGKTLMDIGVEFGVSRERVRQVLNRGGVDTAFRAPPLTDEQIAAIREYEAGGVLGPCAAKAGVSVETFKVSLLPRVGITPRKQERLATVEMLKRCEEAADLIRSGLRVKDVADKFGCAPENIHRYIWRIGHTVKSLKAAA